MGFQLAGQLLDAGHDVAVYNRTCAKAEPLADRDIAFTMVSASLALETVTTGPAGVLTSPEATPGVLDTSRVSNPTLIRDKVAKRGTEVLATR
ncbi:NAD(P)-binding domain-containing protein [Streptomyces sp. NBC_01724]|uniref:NAD(P)-binding domain-containing protein n=1 Tax=unclassified Streptomyces TaxID=2593676 RepID=UPI002E34A632|nr:NAD(P)-binding domain-containing protein [Streptomyces sp. NBC_01724]WTE49276.1 NAD(P)-binding domain-containing protein [Streptomyces sp. NBC_01620]